MAKMQKKNLDTSPDEVRKFENGKIDRMHICYCHTAATPTPVIRDRNSYKRWIMDR
jgi:hypothetical protein